MIKITDDLLIPEDALSFTASRSSGPGGQHVNKSSTRVTLRFDVLGSPSLSAEQKALLLTRLSTRVNKDGVLRVVAQKHRSQSANRELAVARFTELLRAALKRTRPRHPTRVPKAARNRRLEEKKHRGRVKRDRSGKGVWEE
jgi:ribosome-associated protein